MPFLFWTLCKGIKMYDLKQIEIELRAVQNDYADFCTANFGDFDFAKNVEKFAVDLLDKNTILYIRKAISGFSFKEKGGKLQKLKFDNCREYAILHFILYAANFNARFCFNYKSGVDVEICKNKLPQILSAFIIESGFENREPLFMKFYFDFFALLLKFYEKENSNK